MRLHPKFAFLGLSPKFLGLRCEIRKYKSLEKFINLFSNFSFLGLVPVVAMQGKWEIK